MGGCVRTITAITENTPRGTKLAVVKIYFGKVIYKHMLPNAMIPIVNSLGGQLAMIVSGTVVIESVFTFPGIGLYMLSGINARDYPVIRSCVLILALFSAIITLLVDITYGYLDPRIKAQFENYAAKKGGH